MNGHQSAKGFQPLTMNHSDADVINPDCLYDCSVTPDLPHALVALCFLAFITLVGVYVIGIGKWLTLRYMIVKAFNLTFFVVVDYHRGRRYHVGSSGSSGCATASTETLESSQDLVPSRIESCSSSETEAWISRCNNVVVSTV